MLEPPVKVKRSMPPKVDFKTIEKLATNKIVKRTPTEDSFESLEVEEMPPIEIKQTLSEEEKRRRLIYEMSPEEQREKGIFIVHGKILEYDPNSVFLLKGNMKVRYFLVWLTAWK